MYSSINTTNYQNELYFCTRLYVKRRKFMCAYNDLRFAKNKYTEVKTRLWSILTVYFDFYILKKSLKCIKHKFLNLNSL